MPLIQRSSRASGRTAAQTVVLLLLLVAGVAAAIVAWIETSRTVEVASEQGSRPSAVASAEHSAAAAVSPASPSAVPVEPRLSGDRLARAWLTAFCTRSDRADAGWLPEVSSLSSPDLVQALVAAGPDSVGLTSLSSWRVERIDPVALDDRPLDTPTRQVLAYAVTISDGTRSVQKPFILYAYLDPDGRWRVEQVEQPYFSEG